MASATNWYLPEDLLKEGVYMTSPEMDGKAISGREFVEHGQQIDEQLEALRLGYG